jgi:hypothetical protein
MSRLRRLPAVCALACVVAFPAAASAAATHDGQRTFRVTETGHDLNICGFPATFDFVVSSEWHSVAVNGGFHFQLTEVSRWTVTFDDRSLGVWQGRGTETDAFTATPGQVLTFHVNFNGREGPVRIHEHMTAVVAPDGTLRVDVDQVTTDFEACPS